MSNVNSFRARQRLTQPAFSYARAIEAMSGEDQSADVESSSQRPLGKASLLSSDRPRRVLVDRSGLSSTEELQTLAQASTDESSWALGAEGELNTVAYGGILRCHRLVAIRGVGKTLSGVYHVDRVLHVITSESYKQTFTVRRTGQGLRGDEDFRQEAAR